MCSLEIAISYLLSDLAFSTYAFSSPTSSDFATFELVPGTSRRRRAQQKPGPTSVFRLVSVCPSASRVRPARRVPPPAAPCAMHSQNSEHRLSIQRWDDQRESGAWWALGMLASRKEMQTEREVASATQERHRAPWQVERIKQARPARQQAKATVGGALEQRRRRRSKSRRPTERRKRRGNDKMRIHILEKSLRNFLSRRPILGIIGTATHVQKRCHLLLLASARKGAGQRHAQGIATTKVNPHHHIIMPCFTVGSMS